MAKEEKKTKLELALENLDKSYGIGTILSLDSKLRGDYDVISSGSLAFDWKVLGVGGYVKGRMYELMGWEGCLSEDTYIKFINIGENGIVQDCKGGTIKNLYKRFHNRTKKTRNTIFHVTSINDENRIFRNEVADIVKSGIKECLEITTKMGFKIKATKDHKFYNGHEYIALSKLNVNDKVYVHNNTPFSKRESRKAGTHPETTLKWYYKGRPRKINGYWFYKERISRLTYEAHMNESTYEEYKNMLDNLNYLPNDIWTIPDGFEIHHKDENTTNNNFNNLELIDKVSHSRLHAIERHNNLRFMVVPDVIDKIEVIGYMETYDIKCYFPYNNFIADGFVVHNSGKTTLCAHAIAECQKAGGTALCIDAENAIDKEYFATLGVDTSKLLLSQPSCGEEGFNIAMETIRTGEIDLLIIDSDSNMLPKSVVDGEVGDSAIGKKARLNSNAYPKLKSALVSNKTCVLVVSQYREKIGLMFGNPTTTQGGHALKFYSDCRIEITRPAFAKEKEEVYGSVTKVKTIKNKTFSPFKSCQFEIIYGKGIDKFGEIIELGIEMDIIQRNGSWYSYGDVKLGQGTVSVKELMADNLELYEELKERVIANIVKS